MRIGEILLTIGKLTLEQLDGALEAQTTFGARLGTNLVEMNVIDLDTLALALGRRHHVPAALAKHFDIVGPHVTCHVTRELATRYNAVPFGVRETAGKRELWVAAMDPHAAGLEDDIAFAAGMNVVVTVAPELRVLHALEAHYGVKRPVRYLNLRSRLEPARVPERRASIPLVGGPAEPDDSLRDALVPVAQDPRRIRPAPAPTPAPTLVPARAASPTAVTFPPPPPPPLAPLAPGPPAIDVDVDVNVNVDLDVPAPRPALAAADALVRLGAASSRDEIGDVVVDHLRSRFAAGLLLVVRQGIALGWRGFAPEADDTVIANLAIPLSTPSAFARAHDDRAPFRGAPPADGDIIQSRLWRMLKVPTPREIAVLPVLVAGRVVNLLYAQPLDAGVVADVAFAELGQVSAAAGAAFLRIIKQKKEA